MIKTALAATGLSIGQIEIKARFPKLEITRKISAELAMNLEYSYMYGACYMTNQLLLTQIRQRIK